MASIARCPQGADRRFQKGLGFVFGDPDGGIHSKKLRDLSMR